MASKYQTGDRVRLLPWLASPHANRRAGSISERHAWSQGGYYRVQRDDGRMVDLDDSELCPLVDRWIPVEAMLPPKRIRVIAAFGPEKSVHDCFYGHKDCSFGEAREKGGFDYGEEVWRYTADQQPVRSPVTHWMPLPDAPGWQLAEDRSECDAAKPTEEPPQTAVERQEPEPPLPEADPSKEPPRLGILVFNLQSLPRRARRQLCSLAQLVIEQRPAGVFGESRWQRTKDRLAGLDNRHLLFVEAAQAIANFVSAFQSRDAAAAATPAEPLVYAAQTTSPPAAALPHCFWEGVPGEPNGWQYRRRHEGAVTNEWSDILGSVWDIGPLWGASVDLPGEELERTDLQTVADAKAWVAAQVRRLLKP